jgi:hypothetical protein
MAESHVASALRHKRGEIAGEIMAAERRINDLRASLVHVDATLKLFVGSDANPEAIPPRLPRPIRSALGARLRMVAAIASGVALQVPRHNTRPEPSSTQTLVSFSETSSPTPMPDGEQPPADYAMYKTFSSSPRPIAGIPFGTEPAVVLVRRDRS